MAPTWEMFADRLTPEQLAHMRQCDADPARPGDGHRRGMLALAVLYGHLGPGKMN